MKKKEIKYENYVSTTEQILRSTPEEKDKKSGGNSIQEKNRNKIKSRRKY